MTSLPQQSTVAEAKDALDKVMRKARVHFYKPIQIAEILHHARTQQDVEVDRLETYRNSSKRWRDQVTTRLVGRVSTSSARYQDDVFNDNAMPPRLLLELSQFNNRCDGLVEAYVYRSFQKKLTLVYDALEYIRTSDPRTFSIDELFGIFYKQPGLKRSVDKLYEITVYALFNALVAALDVAVTLKVGNENERMLKDFSGFISTVLGLKPGETSATMPAALYRAGVTNDADAGLDI